MWRERGMKMWGRWGRCKIKCNWILQKPEQHTATTLCFPATALSGIQSGFLSEILSQVRWQELQAAPLKAMTEYYKILNIDSSVQSSFTLKIQNTNSLVKLCFPPPSVKDFLELTHFSLSPIQFCNMFSIKFIHHFPNCSSKYVFCCSWKWARKATRSLRLRSTPPGNLHSHAANHLKLTYHGNTS